MRSLYIVFIAIGLVAVSCGENKETEVVEEVAEVQVEKIEHPWGFCPDSLKCVEGKVKDGQFFSTLMVSLGMSPGDAYLLSTAVDSVFDVRSLRIGNAYKAYYDGSLKYLVYDRNRVSSVIFSCQPPFGAKVYKKPITSEVCYADVTVNSSLWTDMRNAGVSPEVILKLSDIYAWTIDFFGLQKGDRFTTLYKQSVCDGEVVAVDTIKYTIFTHGSKSLPCIMFDQKDGGNIYWNEKGESMRKAFLKAPLKFSRISSGFSYARRHPITRRVQPHTGVDYAAPTGTPVMTIGDGVVTSVRYEGAGGNVVRIKHNATYSTAYLHLSRYASGLKAGQRVQQGEVIGYVGSTGRSTGPHLDFRIWKNGTPINPLTMDSPSAEPIKEANKKAFEATCEQYKAQIDTIRANTFASEILKLM